MIDLIITVANLFTSIISLSTAIITYKLATKGEQ